MESHGPASHESADRRVGRLSEHGIDLSSVTPAKGRSPDLEPKRRRAWERLSELERGWVVQVYERPVSGWTMPCVEAGGAHERVLYALVVTGAHLTPGEIVYLQVARWYRNTDIATVRARLARMVELGEAKSDRDGRFYATPEGEERLRSIERRWLALRSRPLPGRRGPGPQSPRSQRAPYGRDGGRWEDGSERRPRP